MYIKRFLNLALAMPKHKKYTKDNFANDRIWLNRVREPAVLGLLRIFYWRTQLLGVFTGSRGEGGVRWYIQ